MSGNAAAGGDFGRTSGRRPGASGRFLALAFPLFSPRFAFFIPASPQTGPRSWSVRPSGEPPLLRLVALVGQGPRLGPPGEPASPTVGPAEGDGRVARQPSPGAS